MHHPSQLDSDICHSALFINLSKTKTDGMYDRLSKDILNAV